jgi:hypothetical protein
LTDNGIKTLVILCDLEREHPDRREGHTASEVADRFDGLPPREKPVMTISSYLTHLKKTGHVKRKVSSDKMTAWWATTAKGRKRAQTQG